MSDAREWLAERADPDPLLFIPATAIAMRDALLAVLNECDRVEARTMLRGDMRSDDVRRIIDKALGVTDD